MGISKVEESRMDPLMRIGVQIVDALVLVDMKYFVKKKKNRRVVDEFGLLIYQCFYITG